MNASRQQNMDKLIDGLTDGLQPVRVLFSPVLYISPWIAVAVAYLAGVVHFLGVRMDLREKLADMTYTFELGLAGLIAVFAAYAAGWLAVPDMRAKKWLLAVPTTMFGVFMLWMGCKIAEEGFLMPEIEWHHCFSDAMLMAFVPIATLSLLVRCGATTMPGWMAFMSTLSVAAMGWVTLRITCMADDVGHTMLYHFVPFILLASLLGALARRLYRW